MRLTQIVSLKPPAAQSGALRPSGYRCSGAGRLTSHHRDAGLGLLAQ